MKQELMKKKYPEGTRVELINLDDPYTTLKAGEQGTVIFVDSMSTVHITWDSGSSLGLIPGIDEFKKV